MIRPLTLSFHFVHRKAWSQKAWELSHKNKAYLFSEPPSYIPILAIILILMHFLNWKTYTFVWLLNKIMLNNYENFSLGGIFSEFLKAFIFSVWSLIWIWFRKSNSYSTALKKILTTLILIFTPYRITIW